MVFVSVYGFPEDNKAFFVVDVLDRNILSTKTSVIERVIIKDGCSNEGVNTNEPRSASIQQFFLSNICPTSAINKVHGY